MNRLSVTIVDILGLLVPGTVLLVGCLLPMPADWLDAGSATLLDRIPLLSKPTTEIACYLAVAYVLGFLLRLVSIDLMNRLTWPRWVASLETEAAKLNGSLKLAIDNIELSQGLEALASLCGKRDPGRYAPYFHFAKRVLRGSPDHWAEAERLEAEVRFAAGLFVPLVVLAIDGAVLAAYNPAALLPLIIGLLGAVIVWRTFPKRRVKEVLYDQLLALAVLLYASGKNGLVSAKQSAPEARPA